MAVNPGLAAFFAAISDIGTRAPDLIERQREAGWREKQRGRLEKDWREQDEVAEGIARMLSTWRGEDRGPAGPLTAEQAASQPGIPFVGAQPGLTLRSIGETLPPAPDPFAGFPSSAAPTALDLQRAASFQPAAPAVNPQIALVDRRLQGVRDLMLQHPNQTERVAPILSMLEGQRQALLAGDKAKADAFENAMQRRYDALATAYKEGEATRRTQITADAREKPVDTSKPENWDTATLRLTIAQRVNQYKALENAVEDEKFLAKQLEGIQALADVYNRKAAAEGLDPYNPFAELFPEEEEEEESGAGAVSPPANPSAFGRFLGGVTNLATGRFAPSTAAPAPAAPRPAAPAAAPTNRPRFTIEDVR